MTLASGRGSKSFPHWSITSRQCFIRPVSTLAYLAVHYRWLTPVKSCSDHCKMRVNAPVSRLFVFGPGYRRSEIMPSIAGPTGVLRLKPKFEPRRTSDPTAGCCGIRVTSILERESTRPVQAVVARADELVQGLPQPRQDIVTCVTDFEYDPFDNTVEDHNLAQAHTVSGERCQPGKRGAG